MHYEEPQIGIYCVIFIKKKYRPIKIIKRKLHAQGLNEKMAEEGGWVGRETASLITLLSTRYLISHGGAKEKNKDATSEDFPRRRSQRRSG